MTFPWLATTAPTRDGAARRAAVAAAELADRAALFYRLGFSAREATRRLVARVVWEFDPPSASGPHTRPASLSDAAIAKIVNDSFARRPA